LPDSQSQILILSLFYTNILYIYSIRPNFKGYRCESGIVIFAKWVQGRIKEFVQGGALNFFFPGGAQHLLGPENPLKSIDFAVTWGGGLNPHGPP